MLQQREGWETLRENPREEEEEKKKKKTRRAKQSHFVLLFSFLLPTPWESYLCILEQFIFTPCFLNQLFGPPIVEFLPFVYDK